VQSEMLSGVVKSRPKPNRAKSLMVGL